MEHVGRHSPISPVLKNDPTSLIASALAQRVLFGGGLVRSPKPQPVWHFTTEILPDVLRNFHAHTDVAVVTSDVVGTCADFVCWVIAYQVTGHQHRFFLPLLGAEVGALTRELRGSGVRLWMDGGPERPVLQARIPASKALRASLRELWKPAPVAAELTRNVLATGASLLVPTSLRPADDTPPPSTVSVTAVIPSDLECDRACQTAAALWNLSRGAAPEHG